MQKLWKNTLYLLIIVSFIGCLNPLRKRDRIKNKVEKLVKLYSLDKDTLETSIADTIYRTDTVRTETVSWDTLEVISHPIIVNEITDKEFVVHRDTIRLIKTVNKTDTIYKYRDVIKTVTKTVPISVEPEAPKKKKKCKVPLIGIPCWYVWLPFVLMLFFFTGRGAIKLYKEWKN